MGKKKLESLQLPQYLRLISIYKNSRFIFQPKDILFQEFNYIETFFQVIAMCLTSQKIYTWYDNNSCFACILFNITLSYSLWHKIRFLKMAITCKCFDIFMPYYYMNTALVDLLMHFLRTKCRFYYHMKYCN